jgi:hypothetical protein
LQAKHQLDEEYVYVDAHILCTPAIADIDNDQHDELVVAVSYFYDKEYYDDPAHAHELQGIDKEKYVAGGCLPAGRSGLQLRGDPCSACEWVGSVSAFRMAVAMPVRVEGGWWLQASYSL